MRVERTIEELEKFRAEVLDDDSEWSQEHLITWTHSVRALLARHFGEKDGLVQNFEGINYVPSVYASVTRREAQRSGLKRACGIISSALYQLHLDQEESDEPVDSHSYDPELWAHVRRLVEDKDWKKVASQTAIFVEDRVRRWAGDPKGRNGETQVGKNLMHSVFDPESELACGLTKGETEGWMYLGMGFAQALSNADRHRINERDDARRYAIGVLGLGSLLLTQLRYEHGDIITSRSD